MERYLLFDSGCSTCTKIAHAIEAETDGWLTAHHLGDPEVQALLKRARPDYSWEPTLLEVDGEQVRAFTGLAMRVRLIVGLGPQRAWRVARLVRRAGVPATGVDLGRRELLQRGGALLASLTLFWLPNSGLETAEPNVTALPDQVGGAKGIEQASPMIPVCPEDCVTLYCEDWIPDGCCSRGFWNGKMRYKRLCAKRCTTLGCDTYTTYTWEYSECVSHFACW